MAANYRELEENQNETMMKVAVLIEKISNLTEKLSTMESNCKIKAARIETLEAFQNKLIGYAMAASLAGHLITEVWLKK